MLLIAFAAATCLLTPAEPRQGDVIRVQCPAEAGIAWMNGRKATAFPQGDGGTLALMPVPVLQKPGVYPLEIQDANGRTLQRIDVRVRDARFPIQNITLSPQVKALGPSPGEMETVRAFRDTVTPQRFWEEPFVNPVPGCMTSPFGVRRFHNGKPTGSFHGGLDFRGPIGTPVQAPASGTVRLVREYNIHGHVVGIDHGQGLTSLYLHLSKFATTEGAQVKQGDLIGYVGNTGRSNAPHLHWALSAQGVAINPMQWITVPPCAPLPAAKKPAKRRASGNARARD